MNALLNFQGELSIAYTGSSIVFSAGNILPVKKYSTKEQADQNVIQCHS